MNDSVPVTIGIRRTKPGTVEEAGARYLGSGVFAALASSTQALRRAILERSAQHEEDATGAYGFCHYGWADRDHGDKRSDAWSKACAARRIPAALQHGLTCPD